MGITGVLFALKQFSPSRIGAISVLRHPYSGWFFTANSDPKEFGFTMQGRRGGYGASVGQGNLTSHVLDPEQTDPTMFKTALVGGFFCQSDGPMECRRIRAEVVLLDNSVLPWVFSEQQEKELRAKGENEQVRLFKDLQLESSVCYPVEVNSGGMQAYGVMVLTDGGEGPLERAADVEFVCEPNFDIAADSATLCRFGRQVGTIRHAWL